MANKIGRVPVREQDPKVRATNFEEVCYGYNVDEAMRRQGQYRTEETEARENHVCKIGRG